MKHLKSWYRIGIQTNIRENTAWKSVEGWDKDFFGSVGGGSARGGSLNFFRLFATPENIEM